MKLNTYNRLRRAFPAESGESAASYFERLSFYLQSLAEQFGESLG